MAKFGIRHCSYKAAIDGSNPSSRIETFKSVATIHRDMLGDNSGSGTTSCPECGDPMPMVMWGGTKPVCDSCADGNKTTVGDVNLHHIIEEDEPGYRRERIGYGRGCLHDMFEESKPDGEKSGVHMLVCNCPRCTPR